MKITISLQLMLGVLLSGCTYNTTVSTSSLHAYHHQSETHTQQTHEYVVSRDASKPVQKTCLGYKPLPFPQPQRVNLDKIREASSDAETNKILLENIAVLNRQMIEHAKQQEHHYKRWQQECKTLQ